MEVTGRSRNWWTWGPQGTELERYTGSEREMLDIELVGVMLLLESRRV